MGQPHSRSDAASLSVSVASTTALPQQQQQPPPTRQRKKRFSLHRRLSSSSNNNNSYVELSEEWQSCRSFMSHNSNSSADASGFCSASESTTTTSRQSSLRSTQQPQPTRPQQQPQQRRHRRRRYSFQKDESCNTLACSEASSTAHSSSSTLPESISEAGPPKLQEFYLKKRRPNSHRHGLHWQEDPRPNGVWLHHGWHWPRDYATLRGTVVAHKGKKWLLATQVKQFGSDTWRAAPKGAALPMFYGNLYVLVALRTTQETADSTRSLRPPVSRRLSSRDDAAEESKVSLDEVEEERRATTLRRSSRRNSSPRHLLNIGETTAI